MGYHAEIVKLTSDAGARRLAEIVDEMQATVDACCGGSIAAKKGEAKEAPGSPPSAASAADKRR